MLKVSHEFRKSWIFITLMYFWQGTSSRRCSSTWRSSSATWWSPPRRRRCPWMLSSTSCSSTCSQARIVRAQSLLNEKRYDLRQSVSSFSTQRVRSYHCWIEVNFHVISAFSREHMCENLQPESSRNVFLCTIFLFKHLCESDSFFVAGIGIDAQILNAGRSYKIGF